MLGARQLLLVAMVAGAVLPAAPASAAADCKEDPHPRCLPKCPLYVDVDPGDPVNGIPPSVTIERIPC